MRKLTTIRKVDKLSPIEGASFIEIATFGGWDVIVKKGEFKEGDYAIYFEIDSCLPYNDPRYAFLQKSSTKRWRNKDGSIKLEVLRLKTMKMRGVLSQGLALPVSLFPEVVSTPECLEEFIEQLKNDEVDRLSICLGARHYDEIVEEMIAAGCVRVSIPPPNKKADFPIHLVPKTDEERFQNVTEYLETMKGVEFEATEKADGSSMTFIYAPDFRPEDPFFVCSRNMELIEEEGNMYWKAARQYNLFEKMSNNKFMHNVALQMELVGPGVNGNRDHFEGAELRLFRMYDILNKQWFSPIDRHTWAENHLQIPHVKVLSSRWKVFNDLTTKEEILSFAEGKTDRGYEREGVVFKSMDGTVSFKVISNKYLMGMKED